MAANASLKRSQVKETWGDDVVVVVLLVVVVVYEINRVFVMHNLTSDRDYTTYHLRLC